MEILSVTLTNFKAHSDRHFTFQPGTNAICGENGAGKTSILEAIAWTLFNYRGSYRVEDLIRDGASSAQARVSFISNRDGRTYEVQRCTTRGYTIFDPQLGAKLDYKHIEDEILPWLRQQFSVAPGTDLGKLFSNTIGVPQGTFTADFLQPPEKRKPIFDAILKVEEYRATNQQMLSLEKYAKAESENLDRAIAQYEEALQDLDAVQQRRQETAQEITAAEASLQQLQAQLTTLEAEKEQLMAQAKQVQQLEGRLQQLTVQMEGQQRTNAVLDQAVQRSRLAVQTCEANLPAHQAFLQVETALKVLDQQVKQRQALQKQRDSQQKLLAERQTALTRTSLQLESLSKAEAELQQLEPLVQQQTTLERQQAELMEQLQQIQALKLEQQTLLKHRSQLQTQQARIAQEIERLRSLEAAIHHVPELEQKRHRLQEQLSRVEAARQFEAELRHLVAQGEDQRDRLQEQAETALAILRDLQQGVPSWSNSIGTALDAIASGVHLNTGLLKALWQILADLSEQTSVPKLKQQLQQVKDQLDQSYRQRGEFADLEPRLQQQAQFQAEIEQLQAHLVQLQTQLATEAALQEQRSRLANALTTLGNPIARTQLLARELQQQSRIQTTYAQMQQAQAGIQRTLTDLDAQLESFADLEDQIDEQRQLQQTHQAGYLTYLQHQKDAEQLPKFAAELQDAIAHLQQLERDRQLLQTQYDQLLQTYDPERGQQVEALYNHTRSQADQLAGGLPQQQKLLKELDAQLANLSAIAEKRDRAQAELKQKDKVRRFITFARRVYKEAGPRITERYVQSISREADRLFRELLNRPNVALEWTRDYEIMVQEGAHSRRFINLSGGEQMCAALAVRLALLRVLADIDIAFFDEPTTNMDRPRRESLAEAIANIKSFRQLFVISHDDTFEKVTENIILVERQV